MKGFFVGILSTLTACGFAGHLYLNSILGVFGLSAVPLPTLAGLRASQATVSTLKSRHQAKKSNLSKRFVKRTGRRLASSALAAATVGTVAVIVTATGFEIADYCEDKEALLEEGNLLHGTNDTFDLDQCIEDAKSDTREIIASARNDASAAVVDTWSEARSYSEEQYQELRRSISDQLTSVLEDSTTLWHSLFETTP